MQSNQSINVNNLPTAKRFIKKGKLTHISVPLRTLLLDLVGGDAFQHASDKDLKIKNEMFDLIDKLDDTAKKYN